MHSPSSPSSTILASPSFTTEHSTKFSPLSGLMKNSPKLKPSRSLKKLDCTPKAPRPSTMKPKEDEKQNSKPEEGSRGLPKRRPLIVSSKSQNMPLSPSIARESVRLHNEDLESEDEKGTGTLTFCSCGQLCEAGGVHCSKCKVKANMQEYSGYLYEKNKKSVGELNRFWYSLLGKDLYRIPLYFILTRI